MSDHLGRNPFKSNQVRGEKNPVGAQSPSSIPKPISTQPKTPLRDFILVDLPAGVILLSLKTALLAKAVLFDSAKKSRD